MCNRCDSDKADFYIEREAKVFQVNDDGIPVGDVLTSWELDPHGCEYICKECYEAEYGSIEIPKTNE